MPWAYGPKNQLHDKQLRDVVQSLENFFAFPHFPRLRMDQPGGRSLTGGGIAVPATQVQFDAETVLETPPDSITETEIADDSISTPKLQANSVVATKLAAISLEVGTYIRSTSYTPGVTGWAIDADGDAEFNNVFVRGVYEAVGDDGELLQMRADGVLTGGPEMILYTGSSVEDEPGAVHTARVDDTPTGHWELSTTIESPATSTSDHSYVYLRAVSPVVGDDYNTVTVHATQSAVYGELSVVNAVGATPNVDGMGMRIDDGVRMGFYRNTQSVSVEPYLALHDADNSINGSGDYVYLTATEQISAIADDNILLEVTAGAGIVANTGGITLWQDYGDSTDPYIVMNSSGIGIKGFTGEQIDLTVNSMAVIVDDGQVILSDGVNPWDVFGPWISWNPTATQGVAVSLTVTDASYIAIGKTAIIKVVATFTSTGTAGQPIVIGGFPLTTINSGAPVCGSGYVLDNGTGAFYSMTAQQFGTTTFSFFTTDAPWGAAFGTTPNLQMNNNDAFAFFAIVELA
jgi:hypothetical protein